MAYDSVTAKLDFRPGFHRESTRYAEEGSWYDGNRVRFREGRPENMRGYNKRVATAFDGIARDLLTWSDNDTTKHIMFGTEQKVYSYDGDTNIDVTPLVSTVNLVSVMDYVTGEVTIAVSSTNHNLNTGDWITFVSSTVTAGITLKDQVCLVSVIGVNNYEFVNSTPATGTFNDIGNAEVGYLLPTGNVNAIQGLGYGAGVYNAGVSQMYLLHLKELILLVHHQVLTM